MKKDTMRPAYADFDSAAKFTAIQSIVGKHLKAHPNAICNYSGGSDSDIMIDIIERARSLFDLPPIKYVFFNAGLELKATRDHVQATAEKYGVEIETVRPKVGIVQAARKYGIPFLSKITSQCMEAWARSGIPLSIADEFAVAEDKAAKLRELYDRYPHKKSVIEFLCDCMRDGSPAKQKQHTIGCRAYFKDFLEDFPPDFKISAKCCAHCKKSPAHKIQKGYDMIITGEREAEGGVRSMKWTKTGEPARGCFAETTSGQFRLRPLYYVTNADKAWYKDHYSIRYSDAYEVYGLTRTGCCGCPVSYKAATDLELIRPYEPNVVKAAWNIFGKSYEYRMKFDEYRKSKREEEKNDKRH